MSDESKDVSANIQQEQPESKIAPKGNEEVNKEENMPMNPQNDAAGPAGNVSVDTTRRPPRFADSFIVRPPIYVKGVPVADNLKNRLLMKEIDREERLKEKIAKTHIVDKFFPYPEPQFQLNRLELATDKTAHKKEHQRELHEWGNMQKQAVRRMNEEAKQQGGYSIMGKVKGNKRVERAPPTMELTRWKEKNSREKMGIEKETRARN
jgi:hypothetical protein